MTSVSDLVRNTPEMQLELKVAQLLDEVVKWLADEFGRSFSDKGREDKRGVIRAAVKDLVANSVILDSIHFMKLTLEDDQIIMRFGGSIKAERTEDIPSHYNVLS